VRLTARWQLLRASSWFKPIAYAVTAALWLAAAVSWSLLCFHVSRPSPNLGWDLVTSWRATVVFARGGEPYLRAKTDGRLFLYPPSSLLLMRPIAWFSLRQIQLIGLVVTAVGAWVSVMASVALVGRRWYGPTAAALVWILRYAKPMVAELNLQNATILCLLALIAFYFLATRDHWMIAGALIGLSMSLKPLLLVLLVVFVLERKWKPLVVAVAIPAVLNAVAFILVKDPGEVFKKLPSLLNRSGTGVHLNSAWVDVLRALAIPDLLVIAVRLATVAIALGAAWLAWKRIGDPVLRLVTLSTALLLGSYLAGTLSEIHYMLTVVPFAITAFLVRSPMRWAPAWVGVACMMGITPPAAWLGQRASQNQSTWLAFGMTLVLLTVAVSVAVQHSQDPSVAGTSVAGTSVAGEPTSDTPTDASSASLAGHEVPTPVAAP
jgi:arabinofuranan 3-O-arabinosyltransferase